MKFLNPLPTEANNNYQGLKPALWFFYLYLLLVAFRSFTHMFAQDAGLNSIASIIIFPEVNNLNPNSVIYFIGSLWGSSQIVVLFISIISNHNLSNQVTILASIPKSYFLSQLSPIQNIFIGSLLTVSSLFLSFPNFP